MKKIKLTKKTLRMLAYCGIVGGLALGSLIFFGISQYEKAKYNSSSVVLTGAKSQISTLSSGEQNAQTLDQIAWYSDIVDHFEKVNAKDAKAYKGTAIPAYAFTTLALISFGLCLKHADKAKEAEENE